MNQPADVAKTVLDCLVDEDLIEVESHDEAVEALSYVLAQADGDVARKITEFLDESDVIDEIYATDSELEQAINKVLSARA